MGLNSCYKLTATLKIEIFRHELTAALMPYSVIVARFQASSSMSRCDESQLLRQSPSLLYLMRREEILCAYFAERNSLGLY